MPVDKFGRNTRAVAFGAAPQFSTVSKANKVSDATSGNLAALTIDGDLADAGVAASAFVSGVQADRGLNIDSNKVGLVLAPASGLKLSAAGLALDAGATEGRLAGLHQFNFTLRPKSGVTLRKKSDGHVAIIGMWFKDESGDWQHLWQHQSTLRDFKLRIERNGPLVVYWSGTTLPKPFTGHCRIVILEGSWPITIFD